MRIRQAVLTALVFVLVMVRAMYAIPSVSPAEMEEARLESCKRKALKNVCDGSQKDLEECALLNGAAAEFCAFPKLAAQVEFVATILPGNIVKGVEEREVAIILYYRGQLNQHGAKWLPRTYRPYQLEAWGRAIINSIIPKCSP